MESKRSTKAEIRRRLDEVSALILQGYSSRDIVKYGREKWKISKRQTEKYVAKVNSLLEDESAAARARAYALATARLEMIYSKAFRNNDFRMALQTLKQLHDLQGLFNQQNGSESTKAFAERLRQDLAAMQEATMGTSRADSADA